MKNRSKIAIYILLLLQFMFAFSVSSSETKSTSNMSNTKVITNRVDANSEMDFEWVEGKLVEKVDEYGFKYREFDTSLNGEIKITKYKGIRKKIVIPTYIDKMPVTDIGKYSFADNEVDSIVLPDYIKNIDEEVFRSKNISYVFLPNSISDKERTILQAFSGATFDKSSRNYLANGVVKGSYLVLPYNNNIAIIRYIGNQSNVIIPDTINGRTVTVIGDYAFYNTGVKSVKIPENVRYIGKAAFAENYLTSVKLPESITEIFDHTFSVNSLKNIVIPYYVEKIGYYAFAENKLEDVKLNNLIRKIDSEAFRYNNIVDITFPSSLKIIETDAFKENDLDTVVLPKNTRYYNTTKKGRSFDKNIEIIGGRMAN